MSRIRTASGGRSRELEQAVPLFLHIPKTAGSSLSTLVYANYAGDPGDGDYSERYGPFPGVWVHYDGFLIEDALAPPTPDKLDALSDPGLRAVVGHFVFGLHRLVPRPCTYFTVLRDPVQRVLSLYAHEVVWLQDTHGVMSEGLSLADFVSRRTSRDIDNGQVRRLSGVDFPVGGCTPKALARARNNLSAHFTLTGLTERFDETVLLLAAKLGWEELRYRPKLVNWHRGDLEPPSEDELAAIAEVTRFDADLYRFAEELFEAEVEAMGSGFADELERFRARQAEYASSLRQPVSLNTGTEAELASLPSIGPTLARRIVDHREASGGFDHVRQLLEIKGIGRSRYRYLVTLVATSPDGRP